ncbi:Hypothetical predicted protein [Lecanosticta acicola]|uniref:Uncharacterized protein n=1 Tax=Lecanosticta acicola TaxID=111012 RepID=A0AAI8YTM6_9PEZI|nr:Hypothetical predicted protein [Lecanosticta acicola]
MPELRRSQRRAATAYESNGRDYLAATMGCSRKQFEDWLTSSSVRPHLVLWYKLCYIGVRRFNVGVDWINTGEKGYYYNPQDLEEDLLLMCLGEGNADDDIEGNSLEPKYSDEKAVTCKWITQEVWARAAWRIVKNNSGEGQPFEKTIIEHPSKAYAFVIDILCIAFHSLVHRYEESVWDGLITSAGAESPPTPSTAQSIMMDNKMAAAVALDLDPNAEGDAAEDDEVEMEDEDGDVSSEVSGSEFGEQVPLMECENGSIVSDTSIGQIDEPTTPKAKERMMPLTPGAPDKMRAVPSPAVEDWMERINEDGGVEGDGVFKAR